MEKVKLDNFFAFTMNHKAVYSRFVSVDKGKGTLSADLFGNYYVTHNGETILKTDDMQDAVDKYNEILI